MYAAWAWRSCLPAFCLFVRACPPLPSRWGMEAEAETVEVGMGRTVGRSGGGRGQTPGERGTVGGQTVYDEIVNNANQPPTFSKV